MTSPSPQPTLSRRGMLSSGVALGVGAAALTAAPALAGRGDGGHDHDHTERTAFSARSAVSFLQQVVDAHRATGPRLAQSYQDDSGLTDTAFVYDNALTLIALLAAGDVDRARAIGDAFIYAQQHDDAKTTDGRLRQAYHADTFSNPDHTAHSAYEYGLVGSAVGDLCWAGIALAQLARAIRRSSSSRAYADAALKLATWVQGKASTSGLGGYTFGETKDLEQHKSSEHNIDVYAFFRLMADLTRDQRWNARAEHAWAFVSRVWNADGGHFWTGSDDGAAINKLASQIPLDVQTWSWLAARQDRYATALDWASTTLATTDTPARLNSGLPAGTKLSGVGFGTGTLTADPTKKIDQYNPAPDSAAVWCEGTAQLALSMRLRDRRGDDQDARVLLGQLGIAQDRLGHGQRFGGRVVSGGLVAASSPLHTGFGFGYYPNLHVGATSWAIFASRRINPYRWLS